jgi:hypothetical protein
MHRGKRTATWGRGRFKRMRSTTPDSPNDKGPALDQGMKTRVGSGIVCQAEIWRSPLRHLSTR